MAMSARSSAGKASVYASRLRRAFLLQVHPDRFRSQSGKVRKEQATLVQALSDRMGEHDFLAYTAASSKLLNFPHAKGKSRAYNKYPFSIERKDGTISKLSLQLDSSSPHQILERMAASINFPPPPPAEPLEHSSHHSHEHVSGKRKDVNQFIWAHGPHESYQGHLHTNLHAASKDRNVLHFLQNTDFDQIKQRRLDRINATAAALVARRSFQFSAIDGTGLGWSSASLAICLSRLTALHEEHQSKLHKSFYPFRLVLSSDEFHSKVDMFGGIIRLNPAATSMQWLSTLALVGGESVQMLKNNQRELKKNLSTVENALGLRTVKGHSCGPEEYHLCLEHLAWEIHQCKIIPRDEKSLSAVSNKANLVIESRQTCRRGKLRKDGSFEVGANMDLHKMRKVLADYASKSNNCIQSELEEGIRCQQLVSTIIYEFGIQSVSRVRSSITSDQMSQCLSRLLDKDEAEKEVLCGYLAGQSIAVAGHGQLCHLRDDGSIVIPTNCS